LPFFSSLFFAICSIHYPSWFVAIALPKAFILRWGAFNAFCQVNIHPVRLSFRGDIRQYVQRDADKQDKGKFGAQTCKANHADPENDEVNAKKLHRNAFY